MTLEELREDVVAELASMAKTVDELVALRTDVAGQEPSVRDRTAAAAFMAQFYNGVENVLKRLCRFHAVPLPTGEAWHVELFGRFCEPRRDPLPVLFDHDMRPLMASYRRFRHVAFHGYGFQLEWNRMEPGVTGIEPAFGKFREAVDAHLASLEVPDP